MQQDKDEREFMRVKDNENRMKSIHWSNEFHKHQLVNISNVHCVFQK